MHPGFHRGRRDMRGAYWLTCSESDCPMCRQLLLPDDVPLPPSGRNDPSRRRSRTDRLLAGIRTVMVSFAAIVTVVAAVVTVWRT